MLGSTHADSCAIEHFRPGLVTCAALTRGPLSPIQRATDVKPLSVTRAGPERSTEAQATPTAEVELVKGAPLIAHLKSLKAQEARLPGSYERLKFPRDVAGDALEKALTCLGYRLTRARLPGLRRRPCATLQSPAAPSGAAEEVLIFSTRGSDDARSG
jgi:hypothetical protein